MLQSEGLSSNIRINVKIQINIVIAVVFPVVMYGCESWTIKKAESWRIDGFELQFWRRFLRVSWTARRSNQSILNEISPEYSLEGLMLKLKLQYFGHLMWRTDSFEKTLIVGKLRAGGEGKTEDQMAGWHHRLNGHEFGYALGAGDGQRPGVLQSMGSQRVRHDWGTELNCTDSLSYRMSMWSFTIVPEEG